MRVLVSGFGVLVSLGAMVMCGCRVLLGFVVSAVLMMMRRLSMMMCGSLMVTRRGVMMLGCWMNCGRRHFASSSRK
jgi:hypothetical protein